MKKNLRRNAYRKWILFFWLIGGLISFCSTVQAQGEGSVKTRDADGDGVIDHIAEFDRQGQLLSLAIDENGDGVMDAFQYYAHGVIVRLEKDLDTKPGIDVRYFFKDGKKKRQQYLDGNGHVFREIELDAAGKPLEIREDTNADQRLDTVYHIEKGQITRITHDQNGDGVVNLLELYRNGKLVERSIDANGDGGIEERLLFDEDGSLTERRLDTNQDGNPDLLEAYRDGSIYLRQWDQNQDGMGELRIFYTSEGETERLEKDVSLDGRMDTFQRYKDNRLTLVEKDTNGDGKIDVRISYDNGRQKKALMDHDHDGRFETTHWYDRPPWTRVTELDADGSGHADRRSYFMRNILRRRDILKKDTDLVESRENFDEKGLLLSRAEDRDADGRWDITWYFDARGDFRRAEKDADADGRVDTWYDYEGGKMIGVSEDSNGDGRPDLWEDYDASEIMIKRKKDLDFDGVADIEETF